MRSLDPEAPGRGEGAGKRPGAPDAAAELPGPSRGAAPADPFTTETLTRERAVRLLPELMALDTDALDDSWARDHWLLELPGKWELSRVLLDRRGVVAGFVVASRKREAVHLHRLVVSANRRGLGLGSHLIRCVARLAESAGFDALTLKVDAENPEARRLYRRLGFRTVGRDGSNHLMRGPCGTMLDARALRGQPPKRPQTTCTEGEAE